MEEDIFIVESFLKNKKMLLKHPCWVSEKTIQAIEKLINKNKELEKMVELITLDLYELYKQYPGTIDKFYNHKMCLWEDCGDINREVNCDYCLKQYYKKKASEENG